MVAAGFFFAHIANATEVLLESGLEWGDINGPKEEDCFAG
jgi:hypothetical protein